MSAGLSNDLTDCDGAYCDSFLCDSQQPDGIRSLTFNRTTNEVVFIRILESYNNGEPGFNIGLSCSTPVNDECTNAINIPVNGSKVLGNNTGVTASTNIPITCSSDPITTADVWFKFIAPATGSIVIETFHDNSFYDLFDSQLQVFNSCETEVLYCDEDGGYFYMTKIIIPCEAYIPYSTYYIQIDGWHAR